MTTETSKVLLFITDLPDQLKSVIAFLKKRNYEVFTVSELKDSVTKIFEVQPQFVFLAWDHSDRKVTTFARLLSQTTSAPIIPFINKNTKDSILRFGACPLNPKLYPPLSGPAVERLVLKTGIDDRKITRDRDRSAASAEEVKRAKKLLEDSLNEAQENHDTPPEEPHLAAEVILEKPQSMPVSVEKVASQLNSHNEILTKPKAELQQKQITGYQTSIEDKLKLPLENILANLDESRAFNGSTMTRKSNLIIQKGQASSMKNSTYLIHRGPAENKPHRKNADEELTSPPLFVYCLSLVSEKWCGYFMVSTTTLLDYTQIDLAFSDWIKSQMGDVGELDESQYFELHNLEPDEWQKIRKKSDYSETMDLQEHHFELCFLRVSPDDMRVNLSDDGDYIRVPTDDMPIDMPLEFGLWLHLPENKKYLLYTPQYSILEEKQKQRLRTNKIDWLFISIQHEKFYRYYLLKKYLQDATTPAKKVSAL